MALRDLNGIVINEEEFPPNNVNDQGKLNSDSDIPKPSLEAGVSIKKSKVFSKEWFLRTFFNMTPKQATDSAVKDVLIPSICKMVSEFTNAFLNALLISGGTSTKKEEDPDDTPYRSYNRMYDDPSYRRGSRRYRARRDLDNIVFVSKDEALDVLRYLKSKIRRDGSVTIGHLFDAMEEGTEPNDFEWGWYELNNNNCGVTSVADGYQLELPPAEQMYRRK